jgi:hypothetical protein
MNTFDPNVFLEQSFAEANSTKATPVPEGEFQASIKSVTPRTWSKKDDPTVGGLALDIIWNIDDENVKAQLERKEVTVKQGLMLDLNDAGMLDMSKGKNVQLGRLREAVGLNTPGQAFSFQMLPGRGAKVLVKHRIDGEDIYAEVKGVVKL